MIYSAKIFHDVFSISNSSLCSLRGSPYQKSIQSLSADKYVSKDQLTFHIVNLEIPILTVVLSYIV